MITVLFTLETGLNSHALDARKNTRFQELLYED